MIKDFCYFKKSANETITIHKSYTGWYYGCKYEGKRKTYTKMFIEKSDLVDYLESGTVNWLSEEVFFANASLNVIATA